MLQQLKRLGKQTLVYGVGGIGVRLLSFLLIPVYTRLLTPMDYGVIDLLSVTQALLITILTMGTGPALFRFYYECRTDQERIVLQSSAWWILMLVSVPVLALATFFSSFLSRMLFGIADYSLLIMLMLFATFLQVIQSVPLAIFRARENAFEYVLISVGSLLASMLLSIYLVVVRRLGVLGFFVGNAIGLAISTLLAVFLLRDLRLVFGGQRVKQLLQFGVPASLGLLPILLIDVSSRYFIQWLANLNEVGLYSLGYRFGSLVQILLVSPFVLAWGPFALSIKESSGAKRVYASILTYFLCLAIFPSLGLGLLAPDVLRVMTPSSFWDAGNVVLSLGLSYTLSGAYSIFAVGVYITKKTIYIPLVTLVAMAANFAANFVLVSRWGMQGAGYATLLSYGIMAIGMFMVGKRLYPVSYEWGRIVKLLIVSVVVYAAGRAADAFSWPASAIIRVVLVFGWPLALVAVGFFQKDEIVTLQRAWQTLRLRSA